MPKEEWGVKRVCPTCSTRFYDLQNNPMTCPNCGAVHTAESLASGKARTMVADKADPKSAKVAAADDGEEVVLDDDDEVEEEEDVDLADDVLEDDEDEGDVSLDELKEVGGDGDDD